MRATATVGPEARTVHLAVERTVSDPPGDSYPLFINWGDGTALQTVASGAAASNVAHQYATAGFYRIVVQGDGRLELKVNADFALPVARSAAHSRRQEELAEDAVAMATLPRQARSLGS